MTITELKDILNIPQKKLNGDVARIVRECAAKINEATKIDFHVECEFVRTGRKFTHIIFSVKNRPNILVERTQSVPAGGMCRVLEILWAIPMRIGRT